MWFAYSQANWPRAIDLRSAIERLSAEFRDLSFDADHESVYNVNYCYDEDEVLRLRGLAEKYGEAEQVCDLYLESEITLEDLLDKLQKLDFHRFIKQVHTFLPANLKGRFASSSSVPEEAAESQES